MRALMIPKVGEPYFKEIPDRDKIQLIETVRLDQEPFRVDYVWIQGIHRKDGSMVCQVYEEQ